MSGRDAMAESPDINVDELRRRARRRLVGAVVLALAVAVIVPMLLETEEKPLGEDVSVKIPPIDDGKFVNRLSENRNKDSAKSSNAAKDDAAPAGRPGNEAERPGKYDTRLPDAPASPSMSATDTAKSSAPTATDTKSASSAVSASSPSSSASPPASTSSNASSVSAQASPPVVIEALPSPSSGSASSASAAPSKGNDVAKSSGDGERSKTSATEKSSSRGETKVATAAPSSTHRAAPSDAKSDGHEGFAVQLAAFADDKGANALVGRLKRSGYAAYTEPLKTSKGTLWRVRVGPYPSREAAVTARDRLKSEGQSGIVAAVK
jgi:DedD protein